jgi:predicted transcriptional regulator
MEHEPSTEGSTVNKPFAAPLLTTLTVDIAVAHVSNNTVLADELPFLITEIHKALAGLKKPLRQQQEIKAPAVPVRSSVKQDYIICLEDGKKLRTLKRHLDKKFGMTPDQYRRKWNLPSNYPMVAPGYTAVRKELALKIGLGRQGGGRSGPKKPHIIDDAATNASGD